MTDNFKHNNSKDPLKYYKKMIVSFTNLYKCLNFNDVKHHKKHLEDIQKAEIDVVCEFALNECKEIFILNDNDRLKGMCITDFKEVKALKDEYENKYNIKFNTDGLISNRLYFKVLEFSIVEFYERGKEYFSWDLDFFPENNEKNVVIDTGINLPTKNTSGYDSKVWCAILYYTDYTAKKDEPNFVANQLVEKFRVDNKLTFKKKTFLANFNKVKGHIEHRENKAIKLLERALIYFKDDKKNYEYIEEEIELLKDDLEREKH